MRGLDLDQVTAALRRSFSEQRSLRSVQRPRFASKESVVRPSLNLLIMLASVALSVIVFLATGGRFGVFFLPLLLGAPFLSRRGPR